MLCRCGACKNLKKSFVETGDRLVAASSKFVMVAVSGDENNELGVCVSRCCRQPLRCSALSPAAAENLSQPVGACSSTGRRETCTCAGRAQA